MLFRTCHVLFCCYVLSGKYEYCQGDVREMSGNFEEACCYEPCQCPLANITLILNPISKFLISWKLNICFRKVVWNLYLSLNKANLRDLIAATGLVILFKLVSKRRFFSLCDLEIWWMTPKTIGHLFFATLNFLHHFIAIGELKLELQSGNA